MACAIEDGKVKRKIGNAFWLALLLRCGAMPVLVDCAIDRLGAARCECAHELLGERLHRVVVSRALIGRMQQLLDQPSRMRFDRAERRGYLERECAQCALRCSAFETSKLRKWRRKGATSYVSAIALSCSGSRSNLTT